MTDSLGGAAVYLGVLIAAAVEGEWTYVGAATLVGRGMLDPAAVVAAGAAGAALGDQFYFHLFRFSLLHSTLRRRLMSIPVVARHSARLVHEVRRHETMMVFAIRFVPGMRIALAAACAYAGVPPLKVSLVNAVASLIWALSVLTVVAYVGPALLERVGISGWWSALMPAALILVIFSVLRSRGRGADESSRQQLGTSP